MKLKYLYITGIVAALNILNTNMALADGVIAPSPIERLEPAICIIAGAFIPIIIGIHGLEYVKAQKKIKNTPKNKDN